MRITVKQLKGLIRESVRQVKTRQIHEQASDVENRKQELIKKWAGSGNKNGMRDSEWAQQMMDTGNAMETKDESGLSVHGLSLDQMKKFYPGFTAEDFKEVANAVLSAERTASKPMFNKETVKQDAINKFEGDFERAQQMYAAGKAMAGETKYNVILQDEHGLSLDQMKKFYPGFTAEDFIEVAEEIDPDVSKIR